MLIHTRKLLLGLVVGGACTATASAQELLLSAGARSDLPPHIGAAPQFTPAQPLVQETHPATVLAPVPDDGTGVIRISDCPQTVEGMQERQRHRPPTAGWVAPGRIAMHRMWVPYHKFYPNAWMGQPAGPQQRLPVIYTPIDTTQIGYYYQHVPHWHSYANMVPPVPRPVDWHYSYHMPQTRRVIRHVAPSEDLGAPQPMPTPAGEQPAPPPPTQTDLDRSAAAPELLPLMK